MKMVLITGATAGIGRDVALTLAKRGYRVYATGRREDALAELRASGGGANLVAFALDVTDPASIAAAAARIDVETDGQGVDVLINNAGYGQMGPIEGVSDALVRKQYETNVFGLLNVTRAFVPKMRARGAGRVINVSSVGGRFTAPFMGVYTSTKYAVESLSDALRIELSAFGVDVVLIEPGYIRTNFGDTSMAGLSEAMVGTPWAHLLDRASTVMARFDATGSAPSVVSTAILKAIEARRPRARYFAPGWAGLGLVVNWLPTRLADWTIRKALGFDAMMTVGAAPKVERIAVGAS